MERKKADRSAGFLASARWLGLVLPSARARTHARNCATDPMCHLKSIAFHLDFFEMTAHAQQVCGAAKGLLFLYTHSDQREIGRLSPTPAQGTARGSSKLNYSSVLLYRRVFKEGQKLDLSVRCPSATYHGADYLRRV